MFVVGLLVSVVHMFVLGVVIWSASDAIVEDERLGSLDHGDRLGSLDHAFMSDDDRKKAGRATMGGTTAASCDFLEGEYAVANDLLPLGGWGLERDMIAHYTSIRAFCTDNCQLWPVCH